MGNLDDMVEVAPYYSVRVSWAEVAAYLRAHGIPAEVKVWRPRSASGGFAYDPRVTVVVPPIDAETAKKAYIDYMHDKKEHSRVILDGLSLEEITAWEVKHWGLEYMGWYGVFSHAVAVDKAHYGVIAYYLGGEIWERYRAMLVDRNGRRRPEGAAWAFNDDLTGLSQTWYSQKPGSDWTGLPKSLANSAFSAAGVSQVREEGKYESG